MALKWNGVGIQLKNLRFLGKLCLHGYRSDRPGNINDWWSGRTLPGLTYARHRRAPGMVLWAILFQLLWVHSIFQVEYSYMDEQITDYVDQRTVNSNNMN